MTLASQFPVEVCPNHPEVSSGLIRCARCARAYCSDCVVELDGKPYDAVCKEEQLRDLRSGTTSPIQLASAGRRLMGMFVDGLVFMPVYVVGTFVMASAIGGRPPPGLFSAPLFLYAIVWVLYEALMLQNFGGQTLGKKAAGTKVVNADGSELLPGQTWKRAVSRQLMSVTYVLGIVDSLMVFSDRRRTLHDRFSNTLVVNSKP
jgi:uncharacterized RDD family membrane protein YckC